MKMNTIANLVGAAAIAFVAASCDSAQESAREESIETTADKIEERADDVRKAGEKSADMTENRADAIRETKTPERMADQTEDAADATRKAAENTADDLEKKADAVREQK